MDKWRAGTNSIQTAISVLPILKLKKVGSDVPLVLFPDCIKLKLPLLYPKHSGCDAAVVRRKHALRWLVSFGTQHRDSPLRQVRDSDVAQVDFLTPGNGTPENVCYEENADAPGKLNPKANNLFILIEAARTNF